jgi:hypothetical protein
VRTIVVVVAVSPVSACTVIEPEVGDRLAQCVDADSDPAHAVVFKDQIRPIINGLVPGPQPCSNCHFPNTGSHAGIDAVHLDLSSLGALRKGGINTASTILVPGKPCSSALVQKLRGTFPGPRMPKGGPYWTPEQIQLVMDWIFEGAKGADDE